MILMILQEAQQHIGKIVHGFGLPNKAKISSVRKLQYEKKEMILATLDNGAIVNIDVHKKGVL